MAHSYDDINGWYNQHLGHSVGAQDSSGWATWADDPNAEDNIKNSAEGQAWAARGQQPTTQPAATQPAMGGGYDYHNALDSWYHAAPNTSIDAWIAANPQFTQGITSSHNGEWMNLPGGESFDAVRDKGGANAPVWGSYGYDYNTGRKLTPEEAAQQESTYMAAHGGSGGGAAAGGGSASGSMSASSGPSTSPEMQAERAQLIAQLTKRSEQSLAVDPNDPNIKQQVDPFRAEQERGSRNYMADLAEKSGQHYGAVNLEGQDRVAHEQAARNTGNFQSTLIGKELDSRREEIQAALAERGVLLTEAQRQQLQMELAKINDATQRLGIETNAGTAANQLGLQYNQFDWMRDPENPNNIPNFNG